MPNQQAQVDKARPGDLGALHQIELLQLRHQRRRQSARIGARRLGQHHGGIGRQIAMGHIARRLHRHGGAVEARGQRARRLQSIERGGDMARKGGMQGLGGHSESLFMNNRA
jgi:hypothetical protein